MQKLAKQGVIHRDKHDLCSLLYVSIDEVRYTLYISLECGRFWLGRKVRLCRERRGVNRRVGCVRHNELMDTATYSHPTQRSAIQ